MQSGQPVTYIPIPAGTGGSFAGLLTIDLSASVRYGDEFDIVVRRITTRQVSNDPVTQLDAELQVHGQYSGRPPDEADERRQLLCAQAKLSAKAR